MPDSTLHISSLLLRANPAQLDPVRAAIEALPCAEVALTSEDGKIIVTLETASEAEIVDHLNQLSLVNGVVSASMVYHQADSN